MTDRIPLDHLNSDQYDRLCDELDALRQVARGYCPDCGRGDAAPTVADWEQQKQRADHAEARLRHLQASSEAAGILLTRTADERDRLQAALDARPAATQATEPAASPLRDLIAAALYERERPPRDPHWPDAYPMDREVFEPMADAVLAVILPATHITATLARMSDADVQRVISLYERWVKAGPPPLGTSVSRWWDKRLAELHAALNPKEN